MHRHIPRPEYISANSTGQAIIIKKAEEVEFQSGKVIKFDVLGAEKDEPAEDKNELAKEIANECGNEDINTEA